MFKEIIVVEGRDDTRRLKEIYPDIETLETNGSAVSFETLKRVKVLQEMRGVIVFTDPDFPGNKIRQKVNDFVPGCKQAYIKQKDAIGKNSCGVGVEHAADDVIKEALSNLLTPNGAVVEEIETEFLMHLNLIGHKNSSSLREQLSDELGIGYVNGKQLKKRLMMFGISKQQVIDALNK